jgi:hypothetical protein
MRHSSVLDRAFMRAMSGAAGEFRRLREMVAPRELGHLIEAPSPRHSFGKF